MNKDSLILKLMREKGWSLAEAEEFVADMPDEPAPRPTTQRDLDEAYDSIPRARLAWEAGDTFEVRKGDDKVASRRIVAQRGADGLTAAQRRGVDAGIALCPNCQLPENDHIPGCLRNPKSGFTEKERNRAVTKPPLPPSA